MKKIFVLFLGLCFTAVCFAQSVVIKGSVKEKATDEPVPFAHVFFKGTQQGVTTDLDGNFELKVKGALPADTLVFQCLGYITLRESVVGKSTMAIELESDRILMQEVVIVAGKNPAFEMMEKIVAHKDENNPFKKEGYTCREYSKIRFDLNHFTEDIKKNYLVKPFDYIWENTDTTSDGIPYLPILLVEKTYRHHYLSAPRKEKTILEGERQTGLPGPKIMEFVDDLYFTPNVYDNYVVILDKNFPSPLNDNYKLHYDYYLDSATVDGEKEYQLVFQPKFKRELAFTGEMSIDAETYAVKNISLRFDIMANVNFVRSYLVEQEYTKVDNKHWMLTESDVIGDFTVIENSSDLTGFFGRKNSSYSNYEVNKPIADEVFSGVAIMQIADDAKKKTDKYWVEQRPVTLDKYEQGVENMVDKLEKDPKFIFRKNLLVGIATGYVPLRQFDIGNFYSFYSYNYVEESRIKLGFRTSNKLEFPLSGSVYGAYGTKDERWKYKVEAELGLGPKHKTRIGGMAMDDITQMGRSFNAIAIDHVLASLVQIGDVTSRIYTQNYTGYVEQELATGFVARASYFNSTISPTDTVTFRSLDGTGTTTIDNNYTSAGIDFTLKFSWQNKDLKGGFYDKEDFKKDFRKFPDLRFQYINSTAQLGSDLEYQKITGAMSQHVRMKKLGFLKYYLEAGKTIGEVPYPLLNTPFSNQLVLADNFAFNLMNYLEFAADEYMMANVEHHFDGAILDMIPLVNRLKWRSLVFAKGYWGNLSQQNAQSNYIFPETLSAMNEPYYEIGFGLENIFKIARMDFVWRLNDTTLPDTYQFIVKPSFSFSF